MQNFHVFTFTQILRPLKGKLEQINMRQKRLENKLKTRLNRGFMEIIQNWKIWIARSLQFLKTTFFGSLIKVG